MKDFFKGLAALIVLIASVVAIGWGLASAVRFIFADVNPTVAAALVAGTATVIVSVGTVVITRHLEKRAQTEAELRKIKVPVYTELVNTFMSFVGMGPTSKKKAGSEQQQLDRAMEALKSVTPQLILWGGDEVVSQWSKYRRSADKLEPVTSMFKLEELLLAIRRDFGHSNAGLERGALLGLFVNDVDDLLEEIEKG